MEQTSSLPQTFGWRTLGLWLSLGFWLWKGLSYALIGRFWILLFMILLTLALVYSKNRSNGLYRSLVWLWSLYLMLWGVIRLVLASLMLFSPISDLHVSQHFGWIGNIVSTSSLLMGYELFRRSRSARTSNA
ncbi:MAG: hypothetical protein KTR30_07875 [Saprospiraceae bacterium]|nr:hypothetical protein [Saprospiraceae bacterium]